MTQLTRLARRAIPLLTLLVVCAFALPGLSQTQRYKVTLVVSGLNQPTGLAIDDDVLYFTEVPTPGVAGGLNAVKQLDLENKSITTLHMGEPQPVNIAVGRDGSIYWACLSAGVILKRDPNGVTTEFIIHLPSPSGIAVDRKNTLYFTEVPTPGVPGTSGGMNGVFSTSDGGVT